MILSEQSLFIPFELLAEEREVRKNSGKSLWVAQPHR